MKKKSSTAKTTIKKKSPTKTKKRLPPAPKPNLFISTAGGRISSVEKYMWTSYGPLAFFVDADIPVPLGSAQMVLDMQKWQICEMHAVDNSASSREQALRWVNPRYRKARLRECRRKGVPDHYAWDKVKWKNVPPARIFARMKQLFEAAKNKPAGASRAS